MKHPNEDFEIGDIVIFFNKSPRDTEIRPSGRNGTMAVITKRYDPIGSTYMGEMAAWWITFADNHNNAYFGASLTKFNENAVFIEGDDDEDTV